MGVQACSYLIKQAAGTKATARAYNLGVASPQSSAKHLMRAALASSPEQGYRRLLGFDAATQRLSEARQAKGLPSGTFTSTHKPEAVLPVMANLKTMVESEGFRNPSLVVSKDPSTVRRMLAGMEGEFK
jgi:hypothetical protein